MTNFLISHHGFIVGYQQGALVQLKLEEIGDFEALFKLALPRRVTSSSRFDHLIANGDIELHKLNLPGFGIVTAEFSPKTCEIAFVRNGAYICAEQSGSITCGRLSKSIWETFLVVDLVALQQIRCIVENRWVIASRREIIPQGGVTLAAGPSLICGDIRLWLKYNLPFETHSFPFRFPIYIDGWRLDQLILYDPLAYYVAKGKDAVEQMLISVSSLVNVGRYDGKIIMYTDLSREAVVRAVPEIDPERIFVLEHLASDWVGFVAGKYSILEEDKAQRCAPVVYLDPDLIFNAPIEQLFVDMVAAGRPTAPLEHFSKMATSPSVGAELLREDNALLDIASGFNAGTFSVPNLHDFGYVITAIRAVITNYLDLHGREALRWVDQEAANYVSYRLAHVDTSDVSKYVRYGWFDDAYRLGVLCGVVHFCGIRRQDRVAPMQHYYKLLKEYYHLDLVPQFE